MTRRGTIINIHGCDGSFWPMGPDDDGDVFIPEDQVKGLFDAPVRTDWDSQAQQDGGTFHREVNEWRDLSFGFHVKGHRHRPFDDVYSEFRNAFDYKPDRWDHDARLACIEVISQRSGARRLDVQLHEAPDFDPGVDPASIDYGNPILPLRAGQPYWYEPDVVTSWETTDASGSGTIVVSNPTDVPMRQKWILTRGTWTLPDVSWAGPRGARAPGVDKLTGRDDSTRKILMPPLGAVEGGAVVDLDLTRNLMVRDAHDTNLLARMPVPGRYFTWLIPPWTPETELPVSVTGAPAGGARCQLVQPRRWRKPIGGEQ
ncbi:hypothetical protein DW322_11310 [Rhodococcus rhodnii]|uniref:Minor tail protein n=2 Tax=Rhodococcus rhodnii TaxID=38312 RepID=R7WVB6_9NOCA|nr:hypothetical protein [Rhodococcus rhodnii]EOM78094.1 hypothetical protein Rrhod_0544 [Rhodococcus rhodnii LMG 5362]TXG90698.1 hypothetical protein DW322_11310 [Rhodococcus rhodnii]